MRNVNKDHVDFKTTVTEAFRPSSFFRHGHKSKYHWKWITQLYSAFHNIYCLIETKDQCIFGLISGLFLQILPVGRAIAASPVSLWSEALPVPRLWKEICPQRSPVQTHQSPSLSTKQQDSAHCTLTPQNPHRGDTEIERANQPTKDLWYCDNLLLEARMNWRRVCFETVTWLVGLTES